MKYLKSLITACLFLCAIAVKAHDFEVDGIFYNITDSSNKTVKVTYRGSYSNQYSNEYTGSVTIPETVTYYGTTYSVTSIGSSAFYDCSGLTSIIIPNSVTSIGEWAFSGCSGLTSITVTDGNTVYDSRDNSNAIIGTATNTLIAGCKNTIIPNSVTSIGDYAFWGCDGLTSVTIPNSVTSIGEDAFGYCSGLTSIEIPNSVTSIGGYAFYGCTGLTSVTIGNSVTSIGSYAFFDCSGLTSIEIPNSVTSIGYSAFYECSSLTSVTIPNSVTSIEWGAFAGCSGLTSVTIPNSVTSIGNYVFYECSGLTSITIPNSVTSIGDDAFYGCLNLKEVINCSNLTISKGSQNYGYVGYYADKVINAPNALIEGEFIFKVVDGVNVLYNYFGNATDVVLPDNYKGENYKIGEDAFGYCSGLTSITIPNSVTSIGYSAFRNCNNLKTVINFSNLTFSKGSSDYGYVAYYADKVINASNGFKEGDFVWFENKNGMTLAGYMGNATELTLPAECNNKSVTSIGDYAFWGCSGLTSVTIPNSVTSIGKCAFYRCDDLTSITIPNSVTSIGSYAFYGCKGLTSVTIPNSITSIGYSAFEGCSGLTSITIPNSVTSIGYSAFAGCSSLTSITIPNSVTSIGGSAFLFCSGLTSVTIGNSVTSIGDWAFRNCSGLTSITIPNSVTSIEDYAFEGCNNLKEVINYSNLTISKGYQSNGYVGYYADKVINASNGFKEGDFVWFENENGMTLAGYMGNATELTLPAECNNKSVTSIGNYVFCECSGLTSVTIPNSVTSIGDYAFYGCLNLKEVINYSNLTISKGYQSNGYVGYYADNVINAPNGSIEGDFVFKVVDGINVLSQYFGNATDVVLPDNYKGENYEIGEWAFSGCSGLTSVTIPNSVTSIGSYAFHSCSGLTSITIPNSVTSIGSYAFHSCSDLASITVADGNTIYDSRENSNAIIETESNTLIAGCNNTVIPNSITSIGGGAFYNCSGLTSITIPNSVTSIGNHTFNGCTSLKELCIEDGEDVLALGYNDAEKGLFYDCPLETLYLGRSLLYEQGGKFGNSPFNGIETLTSVGIAASGLDDNLFAGCSNINNVGFNTEVVPSMFANNAKITDITFSGCVKVISDGALVGMDKLTNIVLETPVPPAISSAVFDKLHYKMLYVYILDGCTPIYQACEIWKNFLDIQEYAPDGEAVSQAANVWRSYWDIPEYSVPEGEMAEDLFADVLQYERVSHGVRLPNATGKRISVYTFNGSLVQMIPDYSGETIALEKGAYIIVSDSETLKVVL